MRQGTKFCTVSDHTLPAARNSLQNIPLTGFEGLIDKLRQHETIELGPTSPPPPGPLRSILDGLGSEALIALPFTVDDSLNGALVLCFAESPALWAADDLSLLGIIADGLNAQLSRQRNDQALEAARRSQAQAADQLRATLAAMPELLLEIDAEGRCMDYHCSRPELLAASPERILGRTLEETLPAEIARMQRAAMQQARNDGAASTKPYTLGDGDLQRWYHLVVVHRPATTEAETRDLFLFRISDITREQKSSEQAQILARVVNEMSVMVVIFDPEMRITWANPAFEAHLKQPRDQLIGRRIRDFTHLDAVDPAEIVAHDDAVRNRTRYEGVARRMIDGTLVAAELILEPFHDDDGVFRGFISIQRDVTDRVAAEAEAQRLGAELAAAHGLLDSAIEALPDGLVVYDRDERMVMWNRRFVEINAAVSDVIGKGVPRSALTEALHDRGIIDPTTQQMAGLLSDSRSTGRAAVEHVTTDGKVIRMSSSQMADGGFLVLVSDITDIRSAEWRLTNITEVARIASWDHDVPNRRLTVNAHWFAMLGEPGRTALQIDDREWFARLHPDDRQRIACRLEAVASGSANEFEEEYRLRHRNGHWVHLLSRGRVVSRDAAGRVQRMSGIDLDMTERRQSQERLQDVLEAASVGTWRLDKINGRVVVDEAYARLLGYTASEMQALSHADFEAWVHPEDLARIHERIHSSWEAGRNRVDFEFRMRHKDGSWRWILSKTRVEAWGSDGKPLREAGVHLDITEAREREAALTEARDALAEALNARQHAETRMADIAAVSDDWFWELDPELRITFVSDGLERATGMPTRLVIGRTFEELGVGRSMSPADWAAMQQAFAAQKPIGPVVYTQTNRSTNSRISVRVTGKPVFDRHGRLAGYRGVSTDVSQLIQAAERAETANRAKSSFLATMSHELRTPMTAVLGLTELLQDRIKEPELHEMLGTIRDSGGSLLTVLDSILDLAKIEAGKLTPELEPVAPADLARRCSNLFRPRAEAVGLTFALQIGADCERLRMGDPHRTLQILNNLLGNAIKFTESGAVRLSVAALPENDDWLQLVVEDDGIGMSAEQITRVFDEFEQAEGSITRRYGGTGLGLSITRRLVELLDGTLTLESQPGHGTRIKVNLPMPRHTDKAGQAKLPSNGTSTAPESQLAASGDTHVAEGVPPAVGNPAPAFPAIPMVGLRALVADDNATNRRILQAMLSALGLRITLAEDGREALSHYRPGAFDLLILDISMPELDGPATLQATRRLDRRAGHCPPPALAVTAHAMSHQVEEFMSQGFDGHLSKPFSKASLTDALQDVLRTSRIAPAQDTAIEAPTRG